jgi:hypothetical protein
MLILLLSALAMSAIAVIVHGVGTSWWLQRTSRRFSGSDKRPSVSACARYLILTTIFMLVLHTVEIILWACTYLLVAGNELGSLEAATYFSAVTFTTLGYGDITLSDAWRLLSGFEAINGIVLIGWTTAFLYAVLSRIWGARERAGGDDNE